MKLLGLDIGGTKCAAVVGEWDGERLSLGQRVVCPTDHTVDGCAMVERLLALADTIVETPPDAIGIACGGPMDAARGIVLSPPNLPRFDAVPVAAMASAHFSAPARLVNDANAGALAEWRFGAGRGLRSMVFLTFGTGLGAGIILGGRLLEGANGNAGEVGHVRLAADGPIGYGKRGSFEGFCSGGGIARLSWQRAEAADVRPSYAPLGKKAEEITARDVALAARAGDTVAHEVFLMVGEKLGEGLALLADVLNPEAIVIGGMYPRCLDLLEAPCREAFLREALPEAASVAKILPAALGEEIGDYASLAAALNERS